MADGYLSEKFTKPPEQRDVAQDTVAEGTPPVAETPQTAEVTPQAETTTAAETQAEARVDEFIEKFNTRFGTTYKADDDIKGLFEYPKKISEYEGKIKEFDATKSQVESYKQQLEEYKNNGNSEFLQDPLMRQAFVASQLKKKYPDKDGFALQQIVMADLDQLSDIDVIVKNQKINHPKLSEADIKSALLRKHGIDPETKPEEWDSVIRAELTMDADDARVNIKSLTNGIELPKAVTKEQREQDAAKALSARVQSVEPLKAEFTAFDKFKDGDFEYDVPSDYKSKLPDMFQAMFIDAGMEPTDENKKTAIDMRDAMFLHQNFSKIREVVAKQAQTEIQKKLDIALHNTQPPNVATATDESGQEATLPGLSKFIEDNR